MLYCGLTELHLKSGQKWAERSYSVAGTTLAVRSDQSGTEKHNLLADDRHGIGSVAVSGDSAQALTKRYTTLFGASRGATTDAWPDDKGFLCKPPTPARVSRTSTPASTTPARGSSSASTPCSSQTCRRP